MTWKAIVTADWHLSNSLPHAKPIDHDRPGMTDRFLDQLDVLDQIGEVIEKSKARALFVLGDVWDKRLLDAVTLRHGVEAIIKLSKIVPVFLLPGNHDADSPRSTGTAHRFTSEVFEAFANERIHYLDGSRSVSLADNKIEFFPLPWSPTAQARVDLERLKRNRRDDRKNILLFHHSVVGAFHQGWKCDDGLSPEELCDGWDMVLGGHFHTRQLIEFPNVTAMYVGASMQLHFGDTMMVDGDVMELTFEDGELELDTWNIEAPEFHVCDWKKKLEATVAEGDYVRFFVEATHAEFAAKYPQAERRAEALREAGVHATVVHRPVQQHEERLELSERPSEEEAVSRYLELAEVTGLDPKRLKEIGLAGLKAVRP